MKPKDDNRELAMSRVLRLLELAEASAIAGDLERAHEYVSNAWTIKLKFRLRLPAEQKRLFCKKCLSFLLDGKTARVRVKDGILTTTCLKCGEIKRIPFK
jgi:ribonuclease P protein subunit RPR2